MPDVDFVLNESTTSSRRIAFVYDVDMSPNVSPVKDYPLLIRSLTLCIGVNAREK